MPAVYGRCDVMVEGERIPGEAAVRPKRCRDPLKAAATIGPRGQMQQRTPGAVTNRKLDHRPVSLTGEPDVERDVSLDASRPLRVSVRPGVVPVQHGNTNLRAKEAAFGAQSTSSSRGLGRKRRPAFADGRPSVITMSAVKSFSPRISAEPTP